MSKVAITFSAFQALQNSKGEAKTWGDLKDGGYLGNLVNNEVLGNVFKAPAEIVGENLTYEYKVFKKGKEWNDDVSGASLPSLNRVMFNLPENRLQFNYKISLFGQKEAIQWSKYIGEEDGNIWKQIQNVNNTVALDAVKTYATATGQFKVLTKLGTSGKTKDEYFNDTANIAAVANALMSTQTAVNLGLDPSRLKLYVSPQVMQQITVGIAGTNVSQGAFESIKLGQISNLFGYNFERSIYMGQSFSIIETQVKDFSNVLGVIYNLDSVAFYQQTPLITNYPSDGGNLVRSFGWKPFAAMLPSMEHTSCILVKTVPTLQEVNAARTKLATENPGAYSKLPGGAATTLTQQEYDALVAKASDYDSVFTPNVELPVGAQANLDSKRK